MIKNDLPLLELFTRLRQADLPLGMDDYQLLLRTLQAGFGITDLDALGRLCKTLWVKSVDEVRLFDFHFKQVMTQAITDDTTSQSPKSLIQRFESASPSDAGPTTTASELILRIDDEVQVAKAVMQNTVGNVDISYNRFVQTDEYFPVTRRQMKQSWRYLRRPVREGPDIELDIDATVKEIGREGILLKPTLVPRRTNRAELLLLIDQGGSMIPFHALTRRLVETALRGGRLEKANIYYFNNCPWEYLYRAPTHQGAERIQEILARLRNERTGVLIFSDAGAARGGFNSERSDLTKAFINQFKQHFLNIAWLNPMPRSRWYGTTASLIMQLVPMFEISRRGLDDTISLLRGRSLQAVHILRRRYNE